MNDKTHKVEIFFSIKSKISLVMGGSLDIGFMIAKA